MSALIKPGELVRAAYGGAITVTDRRIFNLLLANAGIVPSAVEIGDASAAELQG